MKQVVSIFLLLLLSFVGASSIAHQLETSDKHCNHEQAHICAPDAHHHCSLCDTLVTLGHTTDPYLLATSVEWNDNLKIELIASVLYSKSTQILGRAPPIV